MLKNSKTSKLALLILNAPVLMMSEQVHSEVQARARLEDVIVTAQKQEENIQNIPIAISVLTGEELAAKGITNFSTIAATAPSVTVSTAYGNRNLLIVFIRGMGNVAPGPGREDAVGFYQDGFYIGSPAGITFDLADVERIEVLRGPQGSLYGKNTTGGAINLISKQPTGEFGFKQTLDFGDRDRFRSLSAIDFPEWNGLSSKVTLVKSSVDGYVENPGSSHDFGEEAQRAARLFLHWSPSESFKADYFAEFGEIEWTQNYYQNDAFNGMIVQGYPYISRGRPRSEAFRPVDVPLSDDKINGHGLTLTWDTSENLTLKSLTGYRKVKSNAGINYADSFQTPSGDPLDYWTGTSTTNWQFSQEFQAIGNFNENLRYVGGLYYFNQRFSFDGVTSTPLYGLISVPEVDQSIRGTSKAIYGQVNWKPDILDNRLEITLGARYTEDHREAEDHLLLREEDLDFDNINPTFVLDYQWTDDLSTYFKVATGYKSGGITFAPPPNDSTFDPEEVLTYEIGLKSLWLDQRVRFNAALFHSKYRDMQIGIAVDLDLRSAQINLAESTIEGAEFDLAVTPIEDVTLNLNYAYLHTSFDKVDIVPGSPYDSTVNPAANLSGDISGLFTLPYAPDHSVNASIDYSFYHFPTGYLSAHLDYRWQSKYYGLSNEGPDVPGRELGATDSYGTVNARLSMHLDLSRGDHATVSLWSKNITDERYEISALPLGGLNVATPRGPAGFTSAAVAWSEPRTYGITLSYEY